MMNHEIAKRLKWVHLYERVQNAGIVCRKCGISRPTLRKWTTRFKQQGIPGLQGYSQRPQHSPHRKMTSREVEHIQELRTTKKLGARRLQNEISREQGIKLSLASIHNVLHALQSPFLKRFRRLKSFKRYQKAIPGERVQMDTCKITPNLYQYTAIDDCTRYRVVGLYPHRSAKHTIQFLADLIEEMPFPIQRIQTDRGREFFADQVQMQLMEYGIKFRPIKPRSPHLNGKVERSQQTDLQEFYSTVDLKDPELFLHLKEWQHYYNWHRIHGSLNGKTPIDVCYERSSQTPYWDEVFGIYDSTEERVQEQNYYTDLQLRKVKRSL
jgi:transposase InsO family protein